MQFMRLSDSGGHSLRIVGVRLNLRAVKNGGCGKSPLNVHEIFQAKLRIWDLFGIV